MRRQAGRAADAANHDDNVVALGQPLSDVDRFLRLPGVVAVDYFDLFAANAARGVLFIDRKVDRLPFRCACGGGIASHRAKYADLDVSADATYADPATMAKATSPTANKLRRSLVISVLSLQLFT